jgi:hypothetical protein
MKLIYLITRYMISFDTFFDHVFMSTSACLLWFWLKLNLTTQFKTFTSKKLCRKEGIRKRKLHAKVIRRRALLWLLLQVSRPFLKREVRLLTQCKSVLLKLPAKMLVAILNTLSASLAIIYSALNVFCFS